MFKMENKRRIQCVENTFKPGGKALLVPGRVLIGQGRMLKSCKKGTKPKVFFLFNDILVYGSIVVPGRLNNNQQIFRLEDLEQENIEDGVGMTNQWILRTPRKSFCVSAASPEEKRAWMDYIDRYRVKRLNLLGFPAKAKTATIWIPDSAAECCMRCLKLFTFVQRKHHCRDCGFVVCKSCSQGRAVLDHISSKPVRVCKLCQPSQDTRKQVRGDSVENPEFEDSSDEELDRKENNVNFHLYEEIIFKS